MVKLKGSKEYELWCSNCQNIIVFDSPEDLRKETAPNSEYKTLYSLICPKCKREIQFYQVGGHDLPFSFTKEVREKEDNEGFVGTILELAV